MAKRKRFSKFRNRIKGLGQQFNTLGKSIGGKLKRRKKRGADSSEPTADSAPAVDQNVTTPTDAPQSNGAADVATGLVNAAAKFVAKDTSENDNTRTAAPDTNEPSTVIPKPSAMDWVKKNWYIPVGGLAVVGALVYFAKRKK